MLTASARAALPLGDTHQAGGCCRFHLPGLGGAAALFLDAGANTTRPRRGPLFYQATTTSTAAALPSSRIQPGQQGCSRSHSSRATSWARFLGILAASAGPTAGTHEAAGLGILIASARCSSIRQPGAAALASSQPRQLGKMRQPGGRLFLDAGPIIPPGATAGRVPWMLQAGGSLPSMLPAGRVPWMLTAAARAALPSTDQHRRGSRIQRGGQHEATGLQLLSSIQGQQLGAGSWATALQIL